MPLHAHEDQSALSLGTILVHCYIPCQTLQLMYKGYYQSPFVTSQLHTISSTLYQSYQHKTITRTLPKRNTMAVIAITTLATSGDTASKIQELEKMLSSSPARFVIGTTIKDTSHIQITSEWSKATSTVNFAPSRDFESFQSQMQDLGATTRLATLDSSPFDKGSAPLIEYVVSDFPASSTPAFKAQIEADFARFETLYRERGDLPSPGEVFLSVGWTEEYTKGDDKVISWLVARGWQNMERFEESVQTEVFKEAIPILMGWGAPFDLVSTECLDIAPKLIIQQYHVERKAGREQS